MDFITKNYKQNQMIWSTIDPLISFVSFSQCSFIKWLITNPFYLSSIFSSLMLHAALSSVFYTYLDLWLIFYLILQRIIGVKKSGSSGSLELFADGDPLKPQAFYSLEKTITLSKGDGIFARCVYDSRFVEKMLFLKILWSPSHNFWGPNSATFRNEKSSFISWSTFE